MAAAFHSSTIRSAMAALAGSGHGSPVKALVSPSSGCAENSVGIKPLRGARKKKPSPRFLRQRTPAPLSAGRNICYLQAGQAESRRQTASR
jgi:hypothetical protein